MAMTSRLTCVTAPRWTVESRKYAREFGHLVGTRRDAAASRQSVRNRQYYDVDAPRGRRAPGRVSRQGLSFETSAHLETSTGGGVLGIVDEHGPCQLVGFVRSRGLAVVATRGPDGAPQAALVGIAATDAGELVFDCSRESRKYVNIERHPEVAVVVGWDDEVTVQIEGLADVLTGDELKRCTERTSRSIQMAGPGPSPRRSDTSGSRLAGFGTPTSGRRLRQFRNQAVSTSPGALP